MAGSPLFEGKRLLIFVVAYDAEKTLARVLDRIPDELRCPGVEVLVIDDCSRDRTLEEGEMYRRANPDWAIRVLKTPENQGYGGNQKLGYAYAIREGFDYVVLLHGDGQYAPESMPEVLAPLIEGKAEVVLGSRMMSATGSLRGGMPLYKYVGNRVLTWFQNRVLGTGFSEFHSGYRAFSVAALAKIPLQRNANGFHFDTEIILQLLASGARVVEVPIPTYYGDEICHVNGFRYAADVAKATLRYRAHAVGLLYDGRFDLGFSPYRSKSGFVSSHTWAVGRVPSGSRVLDLGCGEGSVARDLAAKGCRVTAVDQRVPGFAAEGVDFFRWDLDAGFPELDPSAFDVVLLLDVIEHLRRPEEFLETLRARASGKKPQVLITTGNVGFVSVRFGLLAGRFAYTQHGILDRTHTRLFTFRSLCAALTNSGYRIDAVAGVPAPFPLVLGAGWAGKFALGLNALLLRCWRGMFSYQIAASAKPNPTVGELLAQDGDGGGGTGAGEAHRYDATRPAATAISAGNCMRKTTAARSRSSSIW